MQYEQEKVEIEQTAQKSTTTLEGISDVKATIHGFLVEDRNANKVQRILGVSRHYMIKQAHDNENIQFMMWIFDKGKLLKKMLTASWMLGNINYACHKDVNKNWRLNLQKLCRDALNIFSVDN